MMPHAIRRVYIARRARTAASVTIALVGTALLAIAMQPSWAQWIARGLPGINPAVLCTLVVAMWIVGMFAYVAARALDEHRFAVAMSRLVMPGSDVNEDIERLAHEHPDHLARDMAHRLEVRSAALPVLAAGVLLPVTALYIGAAIRAGGWPVIAEFEAMVALHAKKLAACAGVGGVLAIAMTKRTLRLPTGAPVMGLLALLTASAAFATTLWVVPVALLVAVVALVVRRLRIERALLEAEDPAAGGEVFTLRGLVRQLRVSLAPVVARVRSIRPVWVLVAGLLVIASVTAMKLVERHAPARAPVATAVAPQAITHSGPAPITDLGPTGSRFTIKDIEGGQVKIALDLVDDRPLVIPALAGLPEIPYGWYMTTRYTLVEGARLDAVTVTPYRFMSLTNGEAISEGQPSCNLGQSPYTLYVRGAPGHYELLVEPVLRPTRC